MSSLTMRGAIRGFVRSTEERIAKNSLVIGSASISDLTTTSEDEDTPSMPKLHETHHIFSLMTEKSIHNGRPGVLERDVPLEDTSDISFEVLRSTVSCRELRDCRLRIVNSQ